MQSVRSTWWSAGTPGLRGSEIRPPRSCSLYHVSQFQRNWYPPLWGNYSDADEDIDRSNLEVTHSTIDDNEEVLDFLERRFRAQVSH